MLILRNKICNTALNFAQRGIKIVPFGQNKRPLFNEWPDRATCDPEVIKMWWEKAFPCSLIVAPTGHKNGFFVFDVDGDEGLKSLARLEKENGEFENSYAVLTPSGGLHLYFLMPEGRIVKNSASLIAPNIDIRGDGGGIILPGSIRTDGEYKIIKDWRNLLCKN